MTKAEMIELLRPKIQAKGAVSGAVTFDLSLYTDFTLSIGADITLNLTNLISPSYIMIEVLHTTAGTTITNLPGIQTWDFSWATGTNDKTILYGRYNGTQWSWQSTIYQSAGTTLSAPGSFTATPGNAQVALAWAAVTSATGYVVDRATNSGFTTGVTLGIYSASGLSFTDTGLTNGTTYYYRIRATASGFTDSGYSTANGTPAASGFASWFTLGSGLEQYNSSKGIRSKTGETGGWNAGHEAWSNEQFSVGQVLTLKFGTISGGHGIFGLGVTRTASYSGTASNSYAKVGFQLISGALYWTDTASANTSASYTPAATDLLRLTYSSGSILAEYSTNAGSSWTTIHTFSTSISGSFYIGFQIYANVTNEGFDEVLIA